MSLATVGRSSAHILVALSMILPPLAPERVQADYSVSTPGVVIPKLPQTVIDQLELGGEINRSLDGLYMRACCSNDIGVVGGKPKDSEVNTIRRQLFEMKSQTQKILDSAAYGLAEDNLAISLSNKLLVINTYLTTVAYYSSVEFYRDKLLKDIRIRDFDLTLSRATVESLAGTEVANILLSTDDQNPLVVTQKDQVFVISLNPAFLEGFQIAAKVGRRSSDAIMLIFKHVLLKEHYKSLIQVQRLLGNNKVQAPAIPALQEIPLDSMRFMSDIWNSHLREDAETKYRNALLKAFDEVYFLPNAPLINPINSQSQKYENLQKLIDENIQPAWRQLLFADDAYLEEMSALTPAPIRNTMKPMQYRWYEFTDLRAQLSYGIQTWTVPLLCSTEKCEPSEKVSFSLQSLFSDAKKQTQFAAIWPYINTDSELVGKLSAEQIRTWWEGPGSAKIGVENRKNTFEIFIPAELMKAWVEKANAIYEQERTDSLWSFALELLEKSRAVSFAEDSINQNAEVKVLAQILRLQKDFELESDLQEKIGYITTAPNYGVARFIYNKLIEAFAKNYAPKLSLYTTGGSNILNIERVKSLLGSIGFASTASNGILQKATGSFLEKERKYLSQLISIGEGLGFFLTPTDTEQQSLLQKAVASEVKVGDPANMQDTLYVQAQNYLVSRNDAVLNDRLKRIIMNYDVGLGFFTPKARQVLSLMGPSDRLWIRSIYTNDQAYYREKYIESWTNLQINEHRVLDEHGLFWKTSLRETLNSMSPIGTDPALRRTEILGVVRSALVETERDIRNEINKIATAKSAEDFKSLVQRTDLLRVAIRDFSDELAANSDLMQTLYVDPQTNWSRIQQKSQNGLWVATAYYGLRLIGFAARRVPGLDVTLGSLIAYQAAKAGPLVQGYMTALAFGVFLPSSISRVSGFYFGSEGDAYEDVKNAFYATATSSQVIDMFQFSAQRRVNNLQKIIYPIETAMWVSMFATPLFRNAFDKVIKLRIRSQALEWENHFRLLGLNSETATFDLTVLYKLAQERGQMASYRYLEGQFQSWARFMYGEAKSLEYATNGLGLEMGTFNPNMVRLAYERAAQQVGEASARQLAGLRDLVLGKRSFSRQMLRRFAQGSDYHRLLYEQLTYGRYAVQGGRIVTRIPDGTVIISGEFPRVYSQGIPLKGDAAKTYLSTLGRGGL